MSSLAVVILTTANGRHSVFSDRILGFSDLYRFRTKRTKLYYRL